MTKNKKLLIGIGMVALLGIVAVGIYQNSRQSTNGDVIRIGAVLPLTGNMSFLGEPELFGLQAAVEEYNTRSNGLNRTMELIVEDSKGDVKYAVIAAQRLVSAKVSAVVTSCSGVSKAVAPVFNKVGIPMFALCSDTSIAAQNPNCINFYVNLDAEQDALARFLKKRGIVDISVLRVNAEAGILAVNLLKKIYPELKVSQELEYDLDRRDFRDLIASIKHNPSHNLYIVGVGIRFSAILDTIREYNVDKNLFGNYMFLSASTVSAPLDVLSRVNFTAFPITVDRLCNTPLGEFFARKGKQMPAFMDYVFAYDAIRFIGMQYDKDTTLQHLRNTKFQSTFGEMLIQKDGNAFVPMRMGHYLTTGKVELFNE